MIILTGGAEMIGNNIIRKLNELGISEIIVLDNLMNGYKCKNLSSLNLFDNIDKDVF